MPVVGPAYAILTQLLKELLIFAIFFFLQSFLFAVLGALLFHDRPEYATMQEALLTIFKASAGVFGQETNIFSPDVHVHDSKYIYMLIYSIISFILIVNLIVGQLASAYRKHA